MPPEGFTTAEGVKLTLTAAQESLWPRFEEYAERVAARRKGRRLVVVLNGDLIDGDHHESPQIMPRDEQEQSAVFLAVWAHFKKLVNWRAGDSVYVMRGTDQRRTHGSRYSADKIAEAIGAERPPSNGASWDLLRVELGGHLIEFTHHAPASVGKRESTRGNAMRSWLRSKVSQLVGRNLRVPSLFVWGHVHVTHLELTDYLFNGVRRVSKCMSLPAFQLPTDYVTQRLPWEPATAIGGAIISTVGVKVDGAEVNELLIERVYTEVDLPGFDEVIVL